MINVSFNYTGEDNVQITGTFVCNRTQEVSVPHATVLYYLCHIGQRTIIKYQRADNAYGVVKINNVDFYTDKNGRLYYDITDELRTSNLVHLIEPNKYLQPIAGVDPEYCMIPPAPYIAQFVSGNDLQIVPPQVILQSPRLNAAYHLQLPIYGNFNEGEQWNVETKSGNQTTVFDGETDDYVENAVCLIDIPTCVNADYFVGITCTGLFSVLWFNIIADCEKVCILRWLAEYGEYKQLIWRIKNIKQSSDAQDLMPREDNYRQRKGRNISFTAFIEGLDAYSYAYYADIITSPDVHCALIGGQDLTDESTRVAIKTGSYILPNGNAGGLQTLEIDVQFKHYDII